MSDPQQPDVRIENRTAHVKNINLGGQVITVPPTEEGTPGIGVTFNDPAERKAFDAALASPVVKAWIDAKELVITGGGAAQSAAPRASAVKRDKE